MQDPFVNPIQKFVFYDKYSRFNWSLGRRETWEETVDRAVDFLRELSHDKLPKEDYNRIRDYILHLKAMPSMRLLAMAGPAARRNNLSIYNCSAMGVDSIEAFGEALMISMSGCGVGYSVERQFVDQLPLVKPQTGEHLGTHVVEDSTEGWVAAVNLGLQAWFNGKDIDFDYSQIRPAGSILYTKGGRASGPEPLMEAMRFMRETILAQQGKKITPLQAHDMMCKIGDAAVSGGTRRTAMIALFDMDDHEMLTCKNAENIVGNEHRWNANNSAVWPQDRPMTKEEIDRQLDIMFEQRNGEPGIFNRRAALNTIPQRRRDSGYTQYLTNPCVTDDTRVATTDGPQQVRDLIGKQFAALVNGKPYVSTEDGFFYTGHKDVFLLETKEGFQLKATSNHLIMTLNGWVPLGKLSVGSTIVLHNHDDTDGTKTATVENITHIGKQDVYDCTIPGVHAFDANGIYVHNCGEIFLKNHQLCNLSIAVARPYDTVETLREKVEVATIIGTIQSMATHFPGMRESWKRNSEEERLLGVDITGHMDCPVVRDPNVMQMLRDHAVETNRRYAQMLGINPSAAVTCAKPSGNSSQMLDVSPGIHARWSKYYVRNIRVSAHSPLYKVLRDSGVPMDPENGQTAENATTWVIHFPVKSPDGAIVRTNRSALEQLEYWKTVKLNYTEHNPSCTITYNDDEQDIVREWIYNNQDILGGISFLPNYEATYDQMPYVEIDEETYKKLASQFPEIDFSLLEKYELEDMTTAAQEVSCFAGACELTW